ncbi:MAG: SOS response-associated peptidase family protein [Ignavibacteriae bacterium]|nr:SOS response-associated peptidase family protein [Ignavibacteriota bacterium]
MNNLIIPYEVINWEEILKSEHAGTSGIAFYEWKKENKKKVPYRIFLKNEEMFFVPGLYNKDKEGNKSVSLITTEPNEFMKEIHNRMPVILNLKDAVEFLSGDVNSNFEKCVPYKDEKNMEMEAAEI